MKSGTPIICIYCKKESLSVGRGNFCSERCRSIERYYKSDRGNRKYNRSTEYARYRTENYKNKKSLEWHKRQYGDWSEASILLAELEGRVYQQLKEIRR